ncbi:tRNA (guanosine(37)-N1)-methyltransferase TrmD [Candidatus Lucifugimonas marina]|jgi:tRNA (guanine37-N1)-methyltransferase|uniref:tRNA (guanine-N(1)-)-methyltransferase n=1 Tax=Candidatus Lucifugimonas marina TaxID=3038979 RepID=A0AAJ5ZEH9_9CHLR|nr:tRNA (guanosine(37)-N1)-methyltransferase TrmD [SAR202 cluster bacterium JH702]MDG0869164.1 tRNA (guanosine(37)-N1)-methyltransferase TrmD [SAR202 cluster bacterium JH639]WFG35784.1 tRNA (guanosine(37)-N1)-methyltransferase TrmD [SAR202 cluster bacterium JH545]WFG39729.1 tRNA (guanosine(37)-N1)-methyltransferase TrmD [SAR202 cluster bacterium JH1073]
MKISIITLFPEMFDGPLGTSIVGRAVETGQVEIKTVQLRDFAPDQDGRRTVDEPPFGGGAGMVLQAEPLVAAVDSVAEKSESKPHVVLMSAQGAPLTHRRAHELSEMDSVTLVCGHYEGVDERFIELRVDEEISIGDFVMTGGEIPAMAVTDAIVRLIPGVLGDDDSSKHDSFAPGSDSLLEGPVYTRPAKFMGLEVPKELLTGDHAKIEAWRRKQALRRTEERRPDLLNDWPETE